MEKPTFGESSDASPRATPSTSGSRNASLDPGVVDGRIKTI
jgi:hypothetical protein